MIQKSQTKNCKSCSGQIPKHASKCQYCSSYQNWRRHLDLSNTFLALLVALVSVVGFTIPIVQKALAQDDSNVSVRYIDRTDVSFPIIVSNDGDRPAVLEPIAGVKLYFVNEQGTKSDHVLLLGLDGGARDDLIIPAKTNKLFYFFVRPDQGLDYLLPNMEKDWDRKHGGLLNLKKCSLHGSFINFQGTEGKYELNIFDAKEVSKNDINENIMAKMMDASGVSIKVPDINELQKQQNPNPNPNPN